MNPEKQWPSFWRPVNDRYPFEEELQRELSPQHPLYGREFIAIGTGFDPDDVLFELPGQKPSLALVHLTWRGSPEPDPEWPATGFYKDWDDWLKWCEEGTEPQDRLTPQ